MTMTEDITAKDTTSKEKKSIYSTTEKKAIIILSLAVVALSFSLFNDCHNNQQSQQSQFNQLRQEGLQQGVTIEALLSPNGISLYDLNEAGLIHVSQVDMLKALEYYAQSRNSGYNSWSQENKAAKETAVELYKNLLQIKIKLPAPDTMTVLTEPATTTPTAQ
jgi:hypothetical protein